MMTNTMQRVLAVGAALILLAIAGGALLIKGPVNEPVACTLEAKLCPDGSAVGRVGPKCEFAECPGGGVDNGGGEVACTKEAKICPDGTSVGRVGPNCEFAACPNKEPGGGDTIYCPQDAKLCPDGKTYVGRTAPSCEFASCPVAVASKDVTIRVGESTLFEGVTFIPLSVEDSRCATGVMCIWAGEAKVAIRATKNGVSEQTTILEKGEGTLFGVHILVNGINPYPNANEATSQNEYRIDLRLSK